MPNPVQCPCGRAQCAKNQTRCYDCLVNSFVEHGEQFRIAVSQGNLQSFA